MVDLEIVAIGQAMEAQGKTRAELGRLLGLDSSQVNRLFNGRRKLQLHEHRKVQVWLGKVDGATSAHSPYTNITPMPGMVPLYGWVGATSASRLVLAEQSLRGYVPMHPAQSHVREAFALEVADVSMVPRYEPGEIAYVAPNRWPRAGQDCVVVLEDGSGMIKQYVRRDGETVVVRQLNPEQLIEIPAEKVTSIHAVVGRG